MNMDQANPPDSSPAPIGFEMQSIEDPPPVGFEGLSPDPPAEGHLYPSIGENHGNGPTPVESTGPEIAITLDGMDGADEKVALSVGDQEILNKRETVNFADGVRHIDYVLAWRDTEDEVKVERRKVFEQNMQKEGLQLEYEQKESSQDGKTYFVKVHAPWDVLTRMAELMSLKMPIKEYDILDDEIDRWCHRLPDPFKLPEGCLPEEPDYFTAAFNRDRQEMFIIEDKATFFTHAQRSLMVHELLLRVKYEETHDKEKFGIDRLIKGGAYTAAFALHEGPFHSMHSILSEGAQNKRHLLYETWARFGRWYYKQPLDLIRQYFGEKIAIYFTWLGFYTSMLIPASLVGLIVFIFGCATVFQNPPSEEICDPEGPGNFTMCPLCDKRCTYWKLRSSCNNARLTYLFDNYATVFFAGFMAIWATLFLEMWKRKQAELRYDWDVADFEMEEHVRPDFEAKTKTRRKNPITQLMEPYLPLWSLAPRKGTSCIVVLFMVCCVLAAVFGVIMYRIIVVVLLYRSQETFVQNNAKIATTATAACISLLIIILLNRVYQYVAMWLTNLERPRTDTEFENSFTFKMFLFQFINYYASIFYIAFFKGRFNGRPGAINYRLGYRLDECDPGGCLIELCIQLGIVMIGKQALNNFKEIMLPKIMNWCRARNAIKKESEENLYTRWEQDNDLTTQPPLGLFDEYLEMVIQYGFITIFVAAFPLAPLFALINNIIEIRLDAYKFVTQWKRPIAVRAQDIGIWYGILRGITFIAVLTNAFIIGWTSAFIPKMVYKFAYSEDTSLTGYVENSLSFFEVSDFQNQSIPDRSFVPEIGNVTFCRYIDYRHPPWIEDTKYEYTRQYWHVFCARLAFVILFEHCVFFLTWLVTYLIPDVPARVKTLMLREVYLAKEARYDAAFSTLHTDRRKQDESDTKLA